MSLSACQEQNGNINNLIKFYIPSLNSKEKIRVNAIYNVLEENNDNISIKLKLMLLTRLIDNYGIIDKVPDILKTLNKCIITDIPFNSKANCDLDLILLIQNMKLNILHDILTNYKEDTKINEPTFRFNKDEVFDNHKNAIININNIKKIIEINIDNNIIEKIIINDNYTINNADIGNNELIQSIQYINDFLAIKKTVNEQTLNNINMDEKIHIYTILYILIKTFYNANADVKNLYKKIIIEPTTRCAPRSVFETLDDITGGYNNKSGDIEYQICKCNFKQNIKKVSAKSAREAAKIVANKVLKGDKKSITFSLKRIIGKKEKCYDYNASIDKSGKILIKSQ
jgi:hypothetical protein